MYERLRVIRFALLIAIPVTHFANSMSAAATPQTTPKSDKIELSDCEIPGVVQTARCGVLEVAENPEKPQGRKLKINVVIIPATTTPALANPIVPLMGGPGEDTVSAAAIFAELFAELRKDRDLLLIDQRGTGKSNGFQCELYSSNDPGISLRDFFPLAAVKRCQEQLQTRADLTQYTYAHFANDVEQVRRALGYESLNLFAGSYGTRAAQVLIRMYPRSVRTVYFGSVVPIDLPTPLTMAKEAQNALEKTFAACSNDASCKTVFPSLREEFRQIITQLESGNVRVAVPGSDTPATIHRGRVVEYFRSLLYRPKTAASLPWMIHQAYLGDWKPIAEGILTQARGIDNNLSVGLFFTITCNEDIAFVRENDVATETQGTFLGDYRVRQQQAACKEWPKVSLREDYRVAVRSCVQSLFVSGDSDGGSPLWYTDHTAPGFSNRAEVIARGQGHTEWSDCIGKLYERFVRTGKAREVAGATCEPMPRPPFKTQ